MVSNPLLTTFIIVTAVAVVIQTCILAALAVTALKTQKEAMAIVREVQGHLNPILADVKPMVATAKDLLNDSAPRVRKITSNLESASDTVKLQADHLHAVVDDLLRRSQRHVAHADTIVGETLTSVDQTRSTVTHIVNQPLKWANAVTNGITAGLDRFLTRKAPARNTSYGTVIRMDTVERGRQTEEILD